MRKLGRRHCANIRTFQKIVTCYFAPLIEPRSSFHITEFCDPHAGERPLARDLPHRESEEVLRPWHGKYRVGPLDLTPEKEKN